MKARNMLLGTLVVSAGLFTLNVQAESITWKFRGTITSVFDPNGALSSSGVDISIGDDFLITWTYDPSIGPTIVNAEVAQWQFGTNRSSMEMAINGNFWDSELNFNDQVFDNGFDENVTSSFRTDLGSAVVTPLDASFTPSITTTSWRVDATGQDVIPDLSWPNSIDLAQWEGGELEIFEEGLDVDSQFYTYNIFGDVTAFEIVPVCDIQMSQETYFDGETVTADVFRFANLSGAPIATEIKVWLELPGARLRSIFNLGSDGRFVLPAGREFHLGPFPVFQVTDARPRGNFEFSCRIVEPTTGELLAEDRNFFDIQ